MRRLIQIVFGLLLAILGSCALFLSLSGVANFCTEMAMVVSGPVLYIIKNMDGLANGAVSFPDMSGLSIEKIIELFIKPAYYMAALFFLGLMTFLKGIDMTLDFDDPIEDSIMAFLTWNKKYYLSTSAQNR